MRVLLSRLGMVAAAVREGWPLRVPTLEGDPRRGTVFLLDGIGGILLAPVTARRGFREAGLPLATYAYDWHVGPRGELLADLVWLRRNRVEGLRFARVIRRFHRDYPGAPLHVVAWSGGTGIAVFAAEHLGGLARINTLVLCCSALSPDYPLGAALQNVDRCYALASRRDYGFLGLGTTVFGTIDRKHCRAAGLVGFRPPPDAPAGGEPWGGKLRHIWWDADMRRFGNHGHHVGTATVAFARHRLAPLLSPPDGANTDRPPRTGIV